MWSICCHPQAARGGLQFEYRWQELERIESDAILPELQSDDHSAMTVAA
jgi:hypothetical protein